MNLRTNCCVIAVFFAITLSVTSCKTNEEIPPNTAPFPSQTMDLNQGTLTPIEDGTGWVADGIIGTDEYSDSQQIFGEQYVVYWKVIGDYIYLGLRVETSGWVGLAFSSTRSKDAADLFIGYVTNGQANLVNSYGISYAGNSHISKSSIGGTSEVLLVGGNVVDDRTTIEFKRRINTGGMYDKAIVNGDNFVLWAFGSDQAFTEHTAAGYAVLHITW